jgi:hydroxymethylglutaryl-CoA lyase
MAIKQKVKIVEVGLRDGLQNESTTLSIDQRFQLLTQLLGAGIKNLEIGAYVSPKWVPQMAGTEQLVKKYLRTVPSVDLKKINASVLVPNEVGMQKAIESGVKEIAIFISSSETFSQKNINCSIAESLVRVKSVMALAKKNKIKVRGYLSVCFGCPYEGDVSEAKVVELAKTLYKMGCYEVSIGDTIGIANPTQVERIFKKLKKVIPAAKLAGHFHDTRGLALTNILTAFKLGIKTFDSSIAGLGGCPYAKGASGNVSTEDVVNMFEQLNVSTGLDINKLVKANIWLSGVITHELQSKVSRALKEQNS